MRAPRDGPPLVSLALIATALATAALLHPESVLRSPEAMDAYFGPQSAPGAWDWAGSWSRTDEPFKYRVLFRGLVDLLAHGLAGVLGRSSGTYWLALTALTAGSIAFATLGCERFLAALGLDGRARLIGVLLWCLIPPIHAAFAPPVQTKEDFVAYGVMFFGLRAIILGRTAETVLWSVVGALTRETLLLLPGVFLITAAPRVWRFGAMAAALGVHAALRIGLGMEGYTVLRVENFESVALVAVSLWAALGWAWAPLLIALAGVNPVAAAREGLARLAAPGATPFVDGLAALRLTAWAAVPAVLAAHLFMGRVQEVRITTILAPWALAAAAPMLRRAPTALGDRLALAAAAAALAALAVAEATGLARSWRAAVSPSIDAFARPLWQLDLYVQLGLAAFVLVLARRSPSRQPLGGPSVSD